MRTAEIERVVELAWKARKKETLLWKYYSSDISEFNHHLVYRKDNEEEINDKGKVIFPKFFRRQCIHYIHTYAGLNDLDLLSYIKSKKGDEFYLLEDFLEKEAKATKYQLGKALSKTLKVKYPVENIVLLENTDFVLVTSEGKIIKKW